MHITRTEYKGFTIETVSHDGLGTVRFRFFVVDRSKVTNNQTPEGFNVAGYPTLNHAKGAITNRLKAVGSVYPQDEASYQAEAAWRYETRTAIAKAVTKAPVRVERVTLSRNKREGKFTGCSGGKVIRRRYYNDKVWSAGTPLWSEMTRSQRKAMKLLGR